MNHRNNARLTFARRWEMVHTMIESKLTPAAAAEQPAGDGPGPNAGGR